MQLKSVGESLNLGKSISDIVTMYSSSMTADANHTDIITGLVNATKGYSSEVIKRSLAESDLTDVILDELFTTDELKDVFSSTIQQEIKASVAAKTLATSTGSVSGAEDAASVSTTGFSTAIKGLGASIKALATAHPTLTAIAVAGASLYAVARIIDLCTVSFDELTDKVSDLTTEVSDSQSTLDGYNEKLKEIEEQIEELNNLDSLSVADEQELEKLEKQKQETENLYKIEKARYDLKQKELEDTVDDYLDKTFVGKYQKNLDESTGTYNYEKVTKLEELQNASDEMIRQQELIDQLEEKYSNGEVSEKYYKSQKEYLEEARKSAEDYGLELEDELEEQVKGLDSESDAYQRIMNAVLDFSDTLALLNNDYDSLSTSKKTELILERFDNSNNLEKQTQELEDAKQNLEDEYKKISDWGFDEYVDQIKNNTIQTTFGNVDMNKRTIIQWSDELKQTYKDELASWNYNPEIGSIDTVFGGSGRYGEDLNGSGWEVAFTPILPNGTFLSKDTVEEYINSILAEAYSDDGSVTEDELSEIDKQGKQIGNTFVQGIFAGVDDSLNYDNNGNWAETVGRLMHFVGLDGAVQLAKDEISDLEFSFGADGSQKIQDFFDAEGITGNDELISEFDEVTKGIQDADSAIQAWKEHLEEPESESQYSDYSLFEGSALGERMSYLKDQFDAGELSYREYFDGLNSEIENVDFSNLTDQFDDVNAASEAFFVGNMQNVTSGLNELISSFSDGEMGATEYIEGYESIGNTLSSLTDELIENSEAWYEFGDTISSSSVDSLKNYQSELNSSLDTISNLKDSVYSISQILSGEVTAGTDEFSSHAQVIAEDLANIVQNGGLMATEVANNLGTTTAEIAANMATNVDNQSIAAQAITANTNAAITSMATSVGNLITTIGNEIANFKVNLQFGIKSITWGSIEVFGKKMKFPTVDFGITATGNSLSTIGSAISSFGNTIKSNIESQKITLSSLTAGKDREYTPSSKASRGGKTSSGSGSGSGGSGGSDSSTDDYENTMDWYEKRINILDNLVNTLKSDIDNVMGSVAKNQLVERELTLAEEKLKNTIDALAMYQQKASEALSAVPSEFRDKVLNGAVAITDFIGQGNEETVEAIEDYQDWADKVSDVKQQLSELQETIRELELEKFNNIVEEFTNAFDIRDRAIDNIDKQISLFEEMGMHVGEGFYNAQIEQAESQLTILNNEKEKLVQQLNESLDSGRVDIGSDQWLEMIENLSDVDSNILDCKNNIEEFENSIQELHWDNLDELADRLSGIKTELENIASLLEDEDVIDDNENWTSAAITRLALAAQEFEEAEYRVKKYQEEIDGLNQAYLDGAYSADEYAEKLQDLKDSQWDAVNDAESAKETIISINEERVDALVDLKEEEIDAMQEVIDKRKEELEAEQELADYRQQLAEKTKSVTDLDRQIAAMSGDTTAATVAKRKKLEAEREEAQTSLDEFNRDHSIDTQKEALDKQLEDYTNEKNAEIEALQATLEEKEALYQQSFELVKQNYSIVASEIDNISATHGVTISNNIVSPWKSGESAIASYGTTLTTQTSVFTSLLDEINTEILKDQISADSLSNTLAEAFSQNAETLCSELDNAYSSVENLNTLAESLRNNFANALESGYDISSIVNSLNEVKNAANEAASAVSGVGSGSSSSSSSNSSSEKKKKVAYYYWTVHYEGGLSHALTSSEYRFKTTSAARDWYARNSSKFSTYKGKKVKSWGLSTAYDYFAKGVKNLKKNQLAVTQDPNGTSDTREMIISPSTGQVLMPLSNKGTLTSLSRGDSVLPNKFTENVWDMAEDPAKFISEHLKGGNIGKLNISGTTLPTSNSSASLGEVNMDNRLIIQGDISDENIKRMQSIAQQTINSNFQKLNRQLKVSGVR